VFLQNIKQKNIEGKFSKLYVPNNKNEKDQVEVSPENYVEIENCPYVVMND
jgi:hypothetical protein